MRYKKVTQGWVVQEYEDGKPVAQEFFAGDIVDYEDIDGEIISIPDELLDNEEYLPYVMIQPRERNV